MSARPPAADCHHPRVALTVDAAHLPRFFLLLQQGVMIRRRIGCPVDSFLRHEIGARQETIELIQSVMLDGRPVDDIASALVVDGATLALSAAMPGLVGATLRRGGAYSSFRSGITHRAAAGACVAGEGWVTVKLFNLVMAELGPGLLRGGVLVGAARLLALLAEMPPEVWRDGGCVTLEGEAIGEAALRDAAWLGAAEQVLLSVSSGPCGS